MLIILLLSHCTILVDRRSAQLQFSLARVQLSCSSAQLQFSLAIVQLSYSSTQLCARYSCKANVRFDQSHQLLIIIAVNAGAADNKQMHSDSDSDYSDVPGNADSRPLSSLQSKTAVSPSHESASSSVQPAEAKPAQLSIFSRAPSQSSLGRPQSGLSRPLSAGQRPKLIGV